MVLGSSGDICAVTFWKKGRQSMKETMLLYHISDVGRMKRLKRICASLNIHVRQVKREEYLRPIFQLLGNLPMDKVQAYKGGELSGEMLVMAVKRERIDEILDGLKKEGLSIPYKAVVTPDNGWWNSLQLYQELQREHQAMK